MSWLERFKKNPPSTAAPVSVQFDQCCHTLILNHIVDAHTNAEALWQKKFTAYPAICEKHTQNSQYRLHTALEKHPARIDCYNEKLKRFRPENFIYSDVLVWLPQIVVDKVLRLNSGALNSLSTNLPALHQECFNTSLLNKRRPHYALRASNVLQADEIAFQFGFGIYVAGTDERAVLQLEAIYVDEHGEQHPFTPQISHQVGSMTATNLVYPEQDNLLIIKPNAHLCTELPDTPWFSEVCSHLQLQRDKAKGQWRVLASSDSANSIKIDTRQHGKEWFFECTDQTFLTQTGQPPRLLFILRPIEAILPSLNPTFLADDTPVIPQSSVPTSANVAINPHQAWGATVIPDLNQGQLYKTIIPGSINQPLLIVEGLALPRIDLPQGRVEGLKQWTIWFDAHGNIVDGNNPIDRVNCAAITANHEQAVAYFKTAGANFSPISGSALALGNGWVNVLANPVPERFHALIQLPHPIQFVLQETIHYTIGRKSEQSIPEIDLTLLNDALGMVWQAGSPRQGSVLSMLSLSRNHLSFQLQQGRLQLNIPANKQPVYVLNADLSLKETLLSSQQACQAVLLPAQYLLLGSFLLRFCI